MYNKGGARMITNVDLTGIISRPGQHDHPEDEQFIEGLQTTIDMGGLI